MGKAKNAATDGDAIRYPAWMRDERNLPLRMLLREAAYARHNAIEFGATSKSSPKACRDALKKGEAALAGIENGKLNMVQAMQMARLAIDHFSSAGDNAVRDLMPEEVAPIHPGVILLLDFLEPLKISQVQLAKRIGISGPHVKAMCAGKRDIDTRSALLLARAFGTTPQFWLGLQANHDILASRVKATFRPF